MSRRILNLTEDDIQQLIQVAGDDGGGAAYHFPGAFEETGMPRLIRYDCAAKIPPRLEGQIRSLLHAEWPGDDGGCGDGPLTDPELHPVYFVLADGDRVLSYGRTIWASVSHLGLSFKLYGLGDVVTAPEFRHKGYGGRVVRGATAGIMSDREADAALLLAGPELGEFYRRCRWDYVPGLRVTTGEGDACAAETLPMMLFLSAKARAARATFPNEVLTLPGDEW